ncbi:MAG: hypothetical protein JSV03_12380, partial [Planctomycetota bacterium]
MRNMNHDLTSSRHVFHLPEKASINSGGIRWFIRHTTTCLIGICLIGNVSMVDAGTIIRVPADHTTIQAAITAANPGDSIEVDGGIYTENLTINKQNLRIRSTGVGGTSTIKAAVLGFVIDVQAGASNLTLGGASGNGFKIQSNIATASTMIHVDNNNGVEISHNEIDTSNILPAAISARAIYVSTNGATNLTIDGNSIIQNDDDITVLVDGPVTNLIIRNNVITGPAAGNSQSVTFNDTSTVDIANIHNNTINGATSNINLGANKVDKITYDANTFTNTTGAIQVQETVEDADIQLTNLTIINNTFNNTAGLNTYAFQIAPSVEAETGVNKDLEYASTRLNYNVFNVDMGRKAGGNPVEVVANLADPGAGTLPDLKAERNWWGDATGPYNATTNPTANGVDVSDKVDYEPWQDAASGGVARYYNVKNLSTGIEYNSIGDALAAVAASNNTIVCEKGTYNEDLSIPTVTGLTLKSSSGRDQTTIQLAGNNVGIDVPGAATNFTLGGAAEEGFTINDVAGTDIVVQVDGNTNGVTISHNAMDTTTSATKATCVGTGGAAGLTIDNNNITLNGNNTDTGVYVNGTVTNLTVSNNTITGPAAGTADSVTFNSGITVTFASINNNIITGATSNINVGVNAFSGITYSQNIFKDTLGAIHATEGLGGGIQPKLKNLNVETNIFNNPAGLDT